MKAFSSEPLDGNCGRRTCKLCNNFVGEPKQTTPGKYKKCADPDNPMFGRYVKQTG